MSGYFDRLGYDKCFIESQFNKSVGPGNYYLYAGARVNPNYNNSSSTICENGKVCNIKQQPNANIGYGYEDVAKRVQLENKLRGSDRILTKCNNGSAVPGKMENVIAFNPYVHERNLFISNMNVEYEMGFGDGKY